MLYVYYGTDIVQSGLKARALIASLRAKKADAAFERVDADSWSAAAINDHLGGQGLFSSKYVIFLDRVTENATAKEELADLIPAMNESPNIFIILEAKPLADLKRAFEKSAEKIVVCDIKAAGLGAAAGAGLPPKREVNVFGIAGAFGSGDAFKAWALYREALEGGAAVEAILGMLFWKAKSLGSVRLARELVVLYHDGHRGIGDLELATERFLLNCTKPAV